MSGTAKPAREPRQDAGARAAARRRQRALRARRRAGETTVRLVVPEHAILEALLVSGRLSEADALHQDLVERALRSVVEDWAARWLK